MGVACTERHRDSCPATKEVQTRYRIECHGTLIQAFTRLGLNDSVDLIFDSHEYGVEKPDPAFFELALAKSHSDRETTAHVGDYYEIDVAGARAADIRPILLDTAGLYNDCDCTRISRLEDLIEILPGM